MQRSTESGEGMEIALLLLARGRPKQNKFEKQISTNTIATWHRGASDVACGGWHTLAVTSGTHLGLDMRRAFEPGLGSASRRDYRNRFDRDRSSMNRGLGHWASDLVLLVSENAGGSKNNDAGLNEDRELPLGYGIDSNSVLSRPLFAHQVVLRNRSPVFAEKIREEEARQAAILGLGKPSDSQLGTHTRNSASTGSGLQGGSGPFGIYLHRHCVHKALALVQVSP